MQVNLEICDTEKIENVSVKSDKTKMTIQGTNYYKHYDIPKGIMLKYDTSTNKLSATFSLELLKEKLKDNTINNKFLTILKDSLDYHDQNINITAWKSISEKSEKLEDCININTHEKYFKNKSHLLYTNNFVGLNTNIGIEMKNKIISICKKIDLEQHLKITGGIIFDKHNTFIENFNKSLAKVKKSKLKNYLISDISPKNEIELNFTYKHIRHIKNNFKLKCTRLIIYYPTKIIIDKLLELINAKLEKPRVLWFVFPFVCGDFNSCFNFSNILSILCWSNQFYQMYNYSIKVLTLTNNNIQTQSDIQQNKIIMEKIKYNLSKDEINLIYDINHNNVDILEKIYLCSLGKSLPKTIYETLECQMCFVKLKKNKNIAYISCGHMFCTKCIIETIKIKQSCPTCRKIIKYDDIIIPNLVLTKMTYLINLLKNIQLSNSDNLDNSNNSITIIYTDTSTLSKKIMFYLNELEMFEQHKNICHILNRKHTFKKILDGQIFICPIEIDFMCENIKNIKNIIVLTTTQNFSLKPESLGYDYCYNNYNIKVWLFECVDI